MAKLHATGVDAFRDYLGEFGLAAGTIDVYVGDLTKAYELGGFMDRLRDDALAPKTRRHILAAARHWATFDDDDQLLKQLKKLRLPPPRRKSAKVPVERAGLFDVIDEVEKADYLHPHMRSVILIMAKRGLRCGDVLRLKKSELAGAMATGTLSFEAKGKRQLEFKVLKTYRKPLTQLAEAEGKWTVVDQLIAPGARSPKARRKAAAKAVERSLAKVGVRAGVIGLHPHRLRRTYAVEYLRQMKGDPEALIHLTSHMRWASMSTAMEYVDHERGDELDTFAEKIFER